jgi:peptidoglycan/xylan/chitin deacetylase (PgdA/CDA1 family)
VSRRLGENSLVLLACTALFMSCLWSFYTEFHIAKPGRVSFLLQPHSAAKLQIAVQSIAEPAIASAAPEPVIAQPAPQPQPAPEPVVNAWQNEAQPMVLPSADQSVPIVSRIQTDKPVIFLGLDDGWFKTPEAHDWLIQHKLPFTLFLENDAVSSNYDYFRDFQAAGMTIEDHTLTHPDMTTLDLDQQKNQICATADNYQTVFGQRPTLFRPPYGSFNDLTLQAAASCGMKAVVTWHAKANGGSIQFQDGNTQFLPGDIVLMHFRNEFLADMSAFMDQVAKDHLQIGRLEDWLQ